MYHISKAAGSFILVVFVFILPEILHIICKLLNKRRHNMGDTEFKTRRFTSMDMRNAYKNGGARERYALENGNKSILFVRGHKCFKFTYSKKKAYQDANGATYDTVTKNWID